MFWRLSCVLIGLMLINSGWGNVKKLTQMVKSKTAKCSRLNVLYCEREKRNLEVWYNGAVGCSQKEHKKKKQKHEKMVKQLKDRKLAIIGDSPNCEKAKGCTKQELEKLQKEFKEIDKAMRLCEKFGRKMFLVWTKFRDALPIIDGKNSPCNLLNDIHLPIYREEAEIYSNFIQKYWDKKKKC